MFLNAHDSVDEQLSRFGYRASGVPGTVKGLLLALEKYGHLPRATIMAPAIKLAKSGLIVSPSLSQSLKDRKNQFTHSPAAMKIFYKPLPVNAGTVKNATTHDTTVQPDDYPPGDRFIQSDLAWSLEQIAKDGEKAFYQGPIATRIAEDMKKNGGLITLEDLKKYQAIERPILQGKSAITPFSPCRRRAREACTYCNC